MEYEYGVEWAWDSQNKKDKWRESEGSGQQLMDGTSGGRERNSSAQMAGLLCKEICKAQVYPQAVGHHPPVQLQSETVSKSTANMDSKTQKAIRGLSPLPP